MGILYPQFIFNIVAEMLAILFASAKEDMQVGGLVPRLVDGGVSILQYADDMVLFLEHDLLYASLNSVRAY